MLDSALLHGTDVSEKRLRQRRVDRRTALVVLVLVALGSLAVATGVGGERTSGYEQVRELSVQFTEKLAAFQMPELPRP